jgi:hypothetical protein
MNSGHNPGLTGDAVSVSSPAVSPEALGSAGLGARRSPVPTKKLVLYCTCIGFVLEIP